LSKEKYLLGYVMSLPQFESDLKAHIIGAISAIEKHYEVLKDYLGGANYELDVVKDTLVNLRDYLGRASMSLQFYMAMKNKPFLPLSTLMQNVMTCLDVAALGPELNIHPRLWIELSLASYCSVRVENIVQMLRLIRTALT
jgi:hypothetical protein